jgi:hypothetical protein
MRFPVLVAALAALAAPSWAQTPDQLTFYGMELGKPLALPPCQAEVIGGHRYVKSLQPTRCLDVVPGDGGRPDFSKDAFIHLPMQEAPRHVHHQIRVVVLEGAAQAFLAYTSGLEGQQALMDQLKAKYGTPTTYKVNTARNQVGGVFDNINAAWDISDSLQVQFVGMAGRTDEGQLLVGTRRGVDEYFARRERNRSSGPKM